MRLCLFSALNDDISGHVRWIHRRILLAIASVLVFRKILPEKACKYASVFYKCAFGALKMMKKSSVESPNSLYMSVPIRFIFKIKGRSLLVPKSVADNESWWTLFCQIVTADGDLLQRTCFCLEV